MNSFKNYFNNLLEIDEKDWQIIAPFLQKVELPKKATLLKFGQVEKYISFVEEGRVRLFVPHENPDKETTVGFSFKGELISAYDSFLTQTPSLYQLETLAKTTLWSISFTDIQKVYTDTVTGNKIGRIMSEKLYLLKSKRIHALRIESTQERYLKLFKERPNLIKQVPLKYIASYLGVTPQALSRIRKRIS